MTEYDHDDFARMETTQAYRTARIVARNYTRKRLALMKDAPEGLWDMVTGRDVARILDTRNQMGSTEYLVELLTMSFETGEMTPVLTRAWRLRSLLVDPCGALHTFQTQNQ